MRSWQRTFLAVALVLTGALTIVVATWQWHNVAAAKLMLWTMSALWLIRAAYQILKPQGTAIPGLSVSLTVVFSVTTLCFLVPLLMSDKHQQ